MDRYSVAQARLIALRIWESYALYIAAACVTHNVPDHWIAGLVGMETLKDAAGYPFNWPDRRSFRFEAGVYAKLRRVQQGMLISYNGVTRQHLKGVTDSVLRLLSTSFGPTQIMAYYLETLFSGMTFKGLGVQESFLEGNDPGSEVKLAHLRDPRFHFFFTGYMMRSEAREWVQTGRLDQLAHIWNAGSPYKSIAGQPQYHTYTPAYVPNVLAVAEAYKQLLTQKATEKLAGEGLSKQARDAKTQGTDFDWRSVQRATQQSLNSEVSDMNIVNDPNTQEEAAALGSNVGGEESTLDRSLIPTDPPQIGVKPGWQTSQGQLTGLFTITIVMLAGYLGYHITNDQAQNWIELGVKGVGLVGALIAGWRQLQTYTNSRGMNYSNAAWATASMQNPFIANDNIQGGSPAAAMGFDISGIFGGKGNKDPQTYINIAKIVGEIAGGRTGKVIGDVTGGLGNQGSGGVDPQFVAQVEDGFKTVVAEIRMVKDEVSTLSEGQRAITQRVHDLETRQDPSKLNPQAKSVADMAASPPTIGQSDK